MTDHEVARTLLRLSSLWPRERSADELREWKRVLQPLEFVLADQAMSDLRDTCTWPPPIAEFRRAYREAAARPSERLALPGAAADLKGVYGHDDWVYCWRCDRAISLGDQLDASGYDPERGLFHRLCPASGPEITAAARLARSQWCEKHHVSLKT